MLNEKITLEICGRSFYLLTDNSEKLYALAAKVDEKIRYFLNSDMDFDFSTILAALSYAEDLSDLTEELEKLRASEAEFKASANEINELMEQNNALRKENEELSRLKKQAAELESKNALLSAELEKTGASAAQAAELSKKLNEAENRAVECELRCESSKKEAEEARAKIEELEKQLGEKPSDDVVKKLAESEKDNLELMSAYDELAKEKKAVEQRFMEVQQQCAKLEQSGKQSGEKEAALVAEKEKLTAELAQAKAELQKLSENASDTDKLAAERDKLASELAQAKSALQKLSENASDTDKLADEKAKLSAELADVKKALDEAKSAASSDESAAAQKISTLEKTIAELKTAGEKRDADRLAAAAEAEKELGEYKQRCAEYEEFKVRFSQLEDENKALRANTESSADNAKEIEAIRAELSDVKQMCDLQAKEIKTLKRTNASLEKQVNELMEDGQLTL